VTPVRSALLALGAVLLLGPPLVWALPSLSEPAAAQSAESRLESARARENALAGGVARLGQLIEDLASDIVVMERKRDEVQLDLESEQAQLRRFKGALLGQRARVARLKGRLARSQRILQDRLVELYKTGDPDMVTVLVNADGFEDLLEFGAFIRRVERQDREVILLVRRSKRQAHEAVARYRHLTERQQVVTAAVARRRDALVTMAAQLQRRRASLQRARAARVASLNRARGNRRQLEREVRRLQASRAASVATAGPGGNWAIPWVIVMCESGGQNFPPNHAGASGYYQFMPATWRALGGSTSQAYQASKGEQDRLAARLWAGGSGAHNWDCAALVKRRD